MENEACGKKSPRGNSKGSLKVLPRIKDPNSGQGDGKNNFWSEQFRTSMLGRKRGELN